MDNAQRMLEAVATAKVEGQQLTVTGSASKRDWLPAVSAQMLTTIEHTGIVAYDPAELVVTAYAGTPIRELLAELAQSGQSLAFEPPQFFGSGTVGGMVSSGLSGPARPWGGSVRDAVLGIEMINGKAERLTFGGQVMKNVAGYDVSRLVAGAYGALGVLLQVSLRTQPLQQHSITLRFALDASSAVAKCRELAQQYLPLRGTWWTDDELYLRLAGSEAAVLESVAHLGGEQLHDSTLWQKVNDHGADFFKVATPRNIGHQGHSLWRIIVPPAAPMPAADPGCLGFEWGGGQRWLWHSDADYVHGYARQHKGWAWALGHNLILDPIQARYMRALKAAFDPDNMFVSALDLGGRAGGESAD